MPAVALFGLKFFKVIRGVYLPIRVALVIAAAAVLPLPSFVEELPARVSSLPAGFQYFMALTNVQFGVAVIMAAWVFRWVWRIIMKVF